MKNIIIPLGAGLIITVAGYIYNQKSVKQWLTERRIDGLPERKQNVCGVCGSEMKIKRRYTGSKETHLVCSQWPDCRKVERL